MKKLFALLAVVLAVVSCQKDADLDVNVGGDIATISVVLPENAITRAGGTDSAQGGLTNTSNEVVRVILQVYYGETASTERLVEYLNEGDITANFNVRLVPDREYTFVAWADIVDGVNAGDKYYDTEDLKAITMIAGSWKAMDEARDAYTHTMTERFTANTPLNMILTRPFAKLRIKTTDMQHLRKVGIEPTTATISYTTKHYTTFNAFEGVAVNKNNENVEHVYEIATYSNETDTNEKTLYADYFFASADEEVVNFTFAVRDQKGEQIKENTFNTSIPVKRNHLTTIAGNILTENNNFDVTLDEKFDGENSFSVKTKEELLSALNVPGASITLENDLTISEKITIKNDVTINGGNKTLTYTGGDRAIDCPDNDVDLTISDLTINCTASFCSRGINFNNGGTLTLTNVTINSNEYDGTNYAINLPVNSDKATVNLTNCEIWAGANALNLWGENTTANITNSKLYVVDDSAAEGYSVVSLNNDGENAAHNSVINVEGGEIKAIYTGEGATQPSSALRDATVGSEINISKTTEIVGEVKIPVANVIYEGYNEFYSFTTVGAAIEKVQTDKNGTVVLIKDLVLTEKINVKASDHNVVLDLNGHNLHMVDNTEAAFEMINNAGTLTIQGEGKLSVEATINSGWNRRSAVISNVVGGNLTVKEGVVIEHFGGTDMAYGIDNLTNGKGTYAVTTIEGATIKSTYSAIRQFLNGIEATNELYVKAGSELIADTRSIFFQDPSKNANTGKLFVEAGAELTGDVRLSVTEGSTEWPVEVCIADSAFVGESTVTNNYCPDGYKIEKNEEGNWVVNLDLMPFKDTTDAPVPGLYVKAGEPNTILVKNVANKSTDVDGASGLEWIAANVAENNGFADYTIKLLEDIDCFKGYMDDGDPVTTAPIGNADKVAFKGVFDGAGHSIKNLYQNGWALNYEWGVYGSIGLFRELEDATVKNVTIEDMDALIEGGDISFIAGSATGTCVFENITIKNSSIGTYNNGCGGIIGWSGAGEYTFKNITLESDVVLGGLWGSFDSSIGGIVGQAEPGATYNFENVTINCRIDAYNDCTASYDYYNYRMCGMIIGRCEETTTINGTNYPDLSKYNLSFNNVVVNYGDWMNYRYCRKSGERAVRVEAGYAYGGIAADRDHSTDDVHCMECIPFNQLIGGDQYAVKGLPAVDGVTVNYPASFNN